MTSEIIDPELKTIVDSTTSPQVDVTPAIVQKDHSDDVPYFVRMIEKGVPIYNDGPPILRSSESKCNFIIIRPLIVKYKHHTLGIIKSR